MICTKKRRFNLLSEYQITSYSVIVKLCVNAKLIAVLRLT